MARVACITSNKICRFSFGHPLQYTSAELRNDKQFVLAAAAANGFALRWASDPLKDDREVVLAACNQDGGVIKYASEALRFDRAGE